MTKDLNKKLSLLLALMMVFMSLFAYMPKAYANNEDNAESMIRGSISVTKKIEVEYGEPIEDQYVYYDGEYFGILYYVSHYQKPDKSSVVTYKGVVSTGYSPYSFDENLELSNLKNGQGLLRASIEKTVVKTYHNPNLIPATIVYNDGMYFGVLYKYSTKTVGLHYEVTYKGVVSTDYMPSSIGGEVVR